MANTKVEVYNAAMALFTACNTTVTPSQLVAALGPVSMAMAPASKQAWALKKLGFDIQANKDGREVVSYTMLSAPATAPVAKPVKAAAKAVKTTATTTKTVKAPKAAVTATATAAAAKPSRKATAAARKSPTVKYGPANKTGRSEFADGRNTDVAVITEGTEVADVNELDDRSDLPEYLR